MAFDAKWILIMKTFKLLLLVALVFLAGVVAGVVGTRIVVRQVMGEVIAHPETVPPRIERSLAFRLRLDSGQRTKLHEIMSGTHEQLKGLRQEYRPRVILVLSNANNQITALLTPEQLARFEKWKKENHPLLEAIKRNQ
jgi:Spy/CpxP family protein refolding chaperone